MTTDLKDLGEQLYWDGFKLAGELYDPDNHPRSLFIAQTELFTNVDSIISGFLNLVNKKEERCDCRKGCCWCCYQKIYILSIEGEIIEQYLHLNYDAEFRKGVILKAVVKKDSESRQPCPFLQFGICSVYPVRPVACRIYLSRSEESCLSDFKETMDAIPALFDTPLHLGRMMNEGYVKGLQKKGLEVKEMIIEQFITNSGSFV